MLQALSVCHPHGVTDTQTPISNSSLADTPSVGGVASEHIITKFHRQNLKYLTELRTNVYLRCP